MNENARKWVAALRDPEAKQITGRLETKRGNCCLGIACRLYSTEHPEWNVQEIGSSTEFGDNYDKYGLPSEVQAWLDLGDRQGSIRFQGSLTDENDNGATFAEIADIIESEPEGLFV